MKNEKKKTIKTLITFFYQKNFILNILLNPSAICKNNYICESKDSKS